MTKLCHHLKGDQVPSLCPYKITMDWIMLEKKDREYVLDFMKFLLEKNEKKS